MGDNIFLLRPLVYMLIILCIKIEKIKSSQKPLKIYFRNSFLNENKPPPDDSSSLLEQDIFNYYYKHNIITKICIGTPKVCFNISLSLSSKRTWICSDKYYNPLKSNTFKRMNEPEQIMTSQGIKVGNNSRDIIKIGNNSIHNEYFNFFLIQECDTNDLGELGIGIGIDDYYNSNNSYLSIIEQLKQKKLINCSMISIRYINDTCGEILIGDNYDKFGNRKEYFDVPLKQNSIIKSELVKEVYILKQMNYYNDMSEEETAYEKKIKLELENRLRVEIDYSSSLISVPEEIFDKLINIGFSKYINNKKLCEIKNDINPNIKYVICDNKILNTNLDKLVIVIDKEKKIKIELNDIFLPMNNNNQIIFGIISEKNINYIYIGDIFLKKYIIYFNKEGKEIRFYNKDILKRVDKERVSFVFIIFIGILSLAILYYMLRITFEKTNTEITYDSNVEKFFKKKDIKKKNKRFKRFSRFML